MKLSDFRNLDRNNIGGWPQGVKLTFCFIVIALLVLAGWWFFISDQQDTLTQKQGQEKQLKVQFSEKQAKVVNFDALKQQLDEMRDMLRQLLRQLPSKTEMPELLVDISQTALSAGIEVQLFKPEAETVKEGFYAEQPITLRMLGTYHQFGTFISGVAALPRVVILTMHNVSLKPAGGKAGPGQLLLEGSVRTYRYVEDDTSTGNAGKPGQHGAQKKGGK
ncbi:MAG TPA: type 4a pilus biogenesis protein PilO [Rudaea sp.]|nr:type 4a pilus biogenesis protein PilO [Rudaea sp.]